MKRQDQIKLIDRNFYRLERCCESTRDWDRYMQQHDEEEKGHRRFCPDHIRCGLSKAQSIRLFAVKEVFERFVPAHSCEEIFTPEAKDIYSIRNSIFGACAIVDTCRAKIRNEFTDHEMLNFLADVDYAELNKDPRELIAA